MISLDLIYIVYTYEFDICIFQDLLAPLQPNPGGTYQAPGAHQAAGGYASNSGLTRSNSIPKMQVYI